MSLLDNLPHECSIVRRKHTKGTLGGQIINNEIEQTAVVCWEQPQPTSKDEQYQKEGMSINSKVYFLSDPQVTTRHRIIITKRNGTDVATADQVELDVMKTPIPDASVGLGIVYKVECQRYTAEV